MRFPKWFLLTFHKHQTTISGWELLFLAIKTSPILWLCVFSMSTIMCWHNLLTQIFPLDHNNMTRVCSLFLASKTNIITKKVSMASNVQFPMFSHKLQVWLVINKVQLWLETESIASAATNPTLIPIMQVLIWKYTKQRRFNSRTLRMSLSLHMVGSMTHSEQNTDNVNTFSEKNHTA